VHGPGGKLTFAAMPETPLPPPGLTDEAVTQSRAEHSRNTLTVKAKNGFWAMMNEVVTEPMFLLLLAACAIYFTLGRTEDAITLLAALLVVSGISVYQSVRSDQALGALRDLTRLKTQIRRNGNLVTIPVDEIVVGDAVLITEGERVPADGSIDSLNDFSVDESILTGESVAVTKTPGDAVFAGTNIPSGSAGFTVTAVGGQTELGKIGRSMADIPTGKRPCNARSTSLCCRWRVSAFGICGWCFNS
jgi:P-type Ca2+ transporter type 2C